MTLLIFCRFTRFSASPPVPVAISVFFRLFRKKQKQRRKIPAVFFQLSQITSTYLARPDPSQL
nr:MAG TPA: hypothetical protein [Caudoviricetes sp.]